MKINKDYRHQIGTHANRINRAMRERSQRTKASPSPGLQNSLAFAKAILTITTLANTLSIAKGAEEHQNSAKREISAAIFNPKFLLHNAMRCAAAFGKTNDIHAHLPKKAALRIPTFASKATVNKVGIAIYQGIGQLRQSQQTAPYIQRAATINQTAPQRAARQTPATPIAATSISNINSIVLTEINAALEKAMPKLFIEYINQLDSSHQHQEIETALMGYIGHLSRIC